MGRTVELMKPMGSRSKSDFKSLIQLMPYLTDAIRLSGSIRWEEGILRSPSSFDSCKQSA